MKTTFLLIVAQFVVLFIIYGQPVNDECLGAIVIGDISTVQTINVDMNFATESLDASCETISNTNRDLWFIMIMPFDGKLRFQGIFGFNRITLYDACGGTELHCGVGNEFINNLTAGSYIIRYSAHNFTGQDEFYVQAFAPAPNDDCAAAIGIADISTPRLISMDSRTAYESLDASCENVSDENLDLWYRFTMPYSGKIRVTGVFGFNRISLYETCGGSELACFIGSGFVEDLNGGIEYILRYAATSVNASQDDIYIQAFAPAVNDECIDAIDIGDVSIQQNISLDIRQATESLDAGCESASKDNLDLWYMFTMPFDGQVRLTSVYGFNRIVIYDGCAGNELACLVGNGFFYGLQGSGNYILRYASDENTALEDNFFIQAFPPPLNDECSGALEIADIQNPQIVAVDSREGTESLDASCEDAMIDNLDLWYYFTMPFDGQLRLTDVFGTSRIVLYDQCAGNELGCLIGNGVFYGLLGSNTYVLRYASSSGQAIQDNFTVQAFPPLLNDECNGALDIPDVQNPQIVSLDSREATESLDASCEDAMVDNLDLWYRFMMPFDGQLRVTGVFGISRIVLYNSCGGNELACNIGDGFFYGLEETAVYLLRYAVGSNNANTDDFTIQAFPVSSNDECAAAIMLNNTEDEQTISLDSREASESLDASCEDMAIDNLDLWFRFSMPFDGQVTINGVSGLNRIVLYDSCNGSELSCQIGGGTIQNLIGGTEYLLRYAVNSRIAGPDNFTIQANLMLPIRLKAFNVIADYKQRSVQVGWETSSEINNYGFELYRSPDAINWVKIAWIEGQAYSTVSNEYSFEDRFPFSGINYYSLKQLDFDGSYEFSPVIQIEMPESKVLPITYPNPAKNTLYFTEKYLSETQSVILRDVTAKLVDISPGQNSIDISSIPDGTYFLSIVHNHQMIYQKIIISR